MNEKPEKYTIKEFYFEPIIYIFKSSLEDLFLGLLICLGWWYCSGCEKHYSPRVKKYKIRVATFLKTPYTKDLCSICHEKETNKEDKQ
jgi:hypothetical protein